MRYRAFTMGYFHTSRLKNDIYYIFLQIVAIIPKNRSPPIFLSLWKIAVTAHTTRFIQLATVCDHFARHIVFLATHIIGSFLLHVWKQNLRLCSQLHLKQPHQFFFLVLVFMGCFVALAVSSLSELTVGALGICQFAADLQVLIPDPAWLGIRTLYATFTSHAFEALIMCEIMHFLMWIPAVDLG